MTPAIKSSGCEENGLSGSQGLHNFKFMYQIGFGGFGKVWKVQNRLTLEYYAMKEMEKQKLIWLKLESSPKIAFLACWIS